MTSVLPAGGQLAPTEAPRLARKRYGRAMARRNRRKRSTSVRREAEDPLTARIRAAAREPGDEEALAERDATVAMVVVRALERAKELAAVEGSGLALRRALGAAEKPLAAYLERHLSKRRASRRHKA